MVDDEWVDAVAPEGQVIINTGIMLERLTNGTIPIGWHRVVAAPGYEGERYSVVQFGTLRMSRVLEHVEIATPLSTVARIITPIWSPIPSA